MDTWFPERRRLPVGERREKKRTYTALRFLAMGLAVAALTGLLVKACNYLLVDDTSSYTRLTMHELALLPGV